VSITTDYIRIRDYEEILLRFYRPVYRMMTPTSLSAQALNSYGIIHHTCLQLLMVLESITSIDHCFMHPVIHMQLHSGY
jgi:hypothetical protein